MKNKAMMSIMPLPLMVMAVITTVTAAELHSGGHIVFRAERGDTFGNLFGPDWQKAFDQNQTTVIRNGKPVTSPDILLEGAILHVGGDVRLTPRALGRMDSLVKRRAALRQRLEGLTGSTGPAAAARAADLRRMLNDDLRYVSDLEFIEREVSTLEVAGPPAQNSAQSSWTWTVAGLAAAAILLAWAGLARRRKEGPGGDARVTAALSDLDQALRLPPPVR
jgi:hypothetical protein